jgi:DNA segregation ATPase FtsK/SpoIIIE-like protein
MTNFRQLEDKIRELEKRVEKLEGGGEKDPLYEDAKRLVTKHGKSSIIFLQRHLMVDFDRAGKILNQLKAEGIIEL